MRNAWMDWLGAARWRKRTMVAAAAAVLGLGGLYLAHAQTQTRPSLTFAGTLTQNGGGVGQTTLTFTFRRAGAALCSPQVAVTTDGAGAFTAEIPIGGCPGDLFDGRDVTVDVAAGGVVVASGQAVSPVPYAKYADRAGTVDSLTAADPDCPAGYVRQAELPNPSNPMSVLCKNGVDEVVKVGRGPAAFWVDRYEATVNTKFDGSGLKGNGAVIPQNGQWVLTQAGEPPGYALSVPGENPVVNITWFQASAFCNFSGKRLPNGDEWLRAAVGTADPSAPNSADGPCLTSGTSPRKTGLGTVCRSQWGAQDMIGNAWEWTADWLGTIATSGTVTSGLWPSGYGGDISYWIGSMPYINSTTPAGGYIPGGPGPAAVSRGGSVNDGIVAGVFSYHIGGSPAATSPVTGFRCVIPR